MPPESARRLLKEASLELARLRRVRGAYRTTWRRIARARARCAFAASLLAAAPVAEPAAAALDPVFRHGFIVDGSILFFHFQKYPAFADIDGDGDADVFVNHDAALGFFENTGTATAPGFTPMVDNPFGLSNVQGSTKPHFADIDGDGDLDALIGTFFGNTILFRNTGSASAPAFAAPSTNPFGLANTGVSFPTFADLDADGDLDAFLGSSGVRYFANTGTATAPAFAAPSANPFGLAPASDNSSPAFVDVDGDGDLDAFVGGLWGVDPGTEFFENTGTAAAPAFAAAETNPFGLEHGGYNTSPTFADVDGDGDLDALVGGYYAQLIAFENTGAANAPAFLAAGNPFGLSVAGGFSTWTSAPYASLALADIEGDGDLDAFIGRADGTTVFFANGGTSLAPAFTAVATNAFGLAGVGVNGHAAPRFGDLDADGDPDALVGRSGGDLVYFANTGSAGAPAFAAAATNPFGLAGVGTFSRPELADVDADGDLDVFVQSGGANTTFFENSGTAIAPAFAAPASNPFGLAPVGFGGIDLADLDADGDLDVVVATAAASIVFENTGSAAAPAFAAAQTNPFGLVDVGALITPTFADIDGDGDLDGLLSDYSGRVFFFENVSLDPDACTDSIDNDGDGRIDLGSDAGCANAADTSELSGLQCDNGLDDDGDGKIDWRGDGSGDPHCSGLLDDRELPPPPGPGCGLGPELLLLGPLLAARRRRPAEG